MKVIKQKSKTMVNINNAHETICMDGTLLGDGNTFKYLGATLKCDGFDQQTNCAFD